AGYEALEEAGQHRLLGRDVRLRGDLPRRRLPGVEGAGPEAEQRDVAAGGHGHVERDGLAQVDGGEGVGGGRSVERLGLLAPTAEETLQTPSHGAAQPLAGRGVSVPALHELVEAGELRLARAAVAHGGHANGPQHETSDQDVLTSASRPAPRAPWAAEEVDPCSSPASRDAATPSTRRPSSRCAA